MNEKPSADAIYAIYVNQLVLPREARARLAEYVRLHGESHVRETLSVSRNAFGRALAGLPVRLGTIALVERGLVLLESPR